MQIEMKQNKTTIFFSLEMPMIFQAYMSLVIPEIILLTTIKSTVEQKNMNSYFLQGKWLEER